MTTIFESPQGQGPGTHVLIIGVGAYTHLIGGTAPSPNTSGLGQLTSPPASARAMIEWFLATHSGQPGPRFYNPSAPLLSLEALIAAPTQVTVQTQTGEVGLDGASLANVQSAFDIWLARVIAHPGCTAIFYFCGHGLAAGKQYALCQDVFANGNRLWANGFDVDATLLALRTKARDCHIHFWIDACRDVSIALHTKTGSLPDALVSSDASDPTIERSTALLRATGVGRSAFGRKGKVSRFTSAVITSLSGYSGTKRPAGPWQVDAGEMAKAVKTLLNAENRTASRKQVSAFEEDGDGMAIVELLEAPKVKVSLDLLPENMREHGELYLCRSGDNLSAKVAHPCKGGSVSLEVPKGYYVVGAQSRLDQFPEMSLDDEEINPPLYGHVFQVAL